MSGRWIKYKKLKARERPIHYVVWQLVLQEIMDSLRSYSPFFTYEVPRASVANICIMRPTSV